MLNIGYRQGLGVQVLSLELEFVPVQCFRQSRGLNNKQVHDSTGLVEL